MSRIEHSPKTIARAQELARLKKSVTEIVRILDLEGVSVSKQTVRSWIDPDYREMRNRRRRKSKKLVHRQAFLLAEGGVPYSAIPTVLQMYHGVSVTEGTVRRWCYLRGAKKNPVRVAQAAQLRRVA
jgi:hypothetical protein